MAYCLICLGQDSKVKRQTPAVRFFQLFSGSCNAPCHNVITVAPWDWPVQSSTDATTRSRANHSGPSPSGWVGLSCPSSSCLKGAGPGRGSLVPGQHHLGEPDQGVALRGGAEPPHLADGLVTVMPRQVTGLLHAVTL